MKKLLLGVVTLHLALLPCFADVIPTRRAETDTASEQKIKARLESLGMTSVDADRHVRDLLSYQPKLGDCLAKCLAILRPLHARRDALATTSNAGRAQLEAADIQNVECDQVSFSNLSQYIFNGHFTIRKKHLSC